MAKRAVRPGFAIPGPTRYQPQTGGKLGAQRAGVNMIIRSRDQVPPSGGDVDELQVNYSARQLCTLLRGMFTNLAGHFGGAL